jgi:transposase
MKKTSGRPISPVILSGEEKRELERRVNAQKTSGRDSLRASIILKRASGLSQPQVASDLACSQTCVSKWTARFRRSGLSGLTDAPGRGRKPGIPWARVESAITRVSRPPKGRERWSVRTMAKELGISPSSVGRIWRANGLKPHRVEMFKISNDPKFEEKFWDVIGLYLNPPARAMVLCCDEKSQCQTLERTQRALPLSSGHVKTFTHDYIRHGTLTLFAALNYLEGKVFSRIEQRHTHKEWLKFLKQVERECPEGLTLHIILDNYATHKQPTVLFWMERLNRAYEKRHGVKRIELHFTPTSGSWMNLVERFFGAITQQALLNASFGSLKDLAQRILDYIAEHNLAPKRYVWKAEGRAILEKIQRAKEKLAEDELRKPI